MRTYFKIIIFQIIIWIGSASLSAQFNLIPDSSFEALKTTPYDACNGIYDSFNKFSFYWTDPTNGTPDIYSTLYRTQGILKLPKPRADVCLGSFGCFDSMELYPHTGNSCAHIFYRFNDYIGSPSPFHKEYIQTKLTATTKSKKYRIVYYYTRGAPVFDYSNYSPLGFLFTSKDITYFTNQNDSMYSDFSQKITPQLEFTYLPYNGNKQAYQRIWLKKDTVVKLPPGCNYLTIGFYGRYPRTLPINECLAYSATFLDDISIINLPGIIGPDTICFGNQQTYTTDIPPPVFWSTNVLGSDTISTDSTCIFDSKEYKVLYCFGSGFADSVRPFIIHPLDKTPNSITSICKGKLACFGYDSSASFVVKWKDNNDYFWRCIHTTGKYIAAINDKYYGCIFQDTWEVQVLDTPLVRHLDTVFCTPGKNEAGISVNPKYTYQIQGNIWTNTPLLWLQPGNYNMLITDSVGCISHSRLRIRALCHPIVFTPTALGKLEVNKGFHPSVAYSDSCVLKIYNRWGAKLAEIHHCDTTWIPPADLGYGNNVYAYYLKVFDAIDKKWLVFTGTFSTLQ